MKVQLVNIWRFAKPIRSYVKFGLQKLNFFEQASPRMTLATAKHHVRLPCTTVVPDSRIHEATYVKSPATVLVKFASRNFPRVHHFIGEI